MIPETQDKIITTKELFSQESIRKKFVDILGKRAPAFMTSVLQVVASNELLKRAEPNSVYNAAAVAATLDLPLNNSLGFAYIVPYNVKVNGSNEKKVVAQFQIGYKGFIQLGQRTGQYKTIAATPIFEGQLVEENPLTGYKFDFKKALPAGAKVIGYASFFQLVNGFEKTFYMTVEELQKHGQKFSKSYAVGLWKTDPEVMYMKTVLKLNLSKFGPLSIELQKSMIVDGALINDAETLDVKYVDNQDAPDKELERLEALIKDAATLEDLKALEKHIEEGPLLDLYLAKKEQLENPQGNGR